MSGNLPRTLPTHVVGIVASAGGLEAMLELFPRLKPTGHTSWVVAQHMGSQAQGDLMARLLARTAVLPVVMAQPDQTLQPDTVYMIPAGYDGQIEHGVLSLVPPVPTNISTPSGNVLFNSMASTQAERCTAVVLSGAGRDGVEGARAIRMAGGRVMVQDPSTVKFNGMPSAAVQAGVADCVLAVPALADALNQQDQAPLPVRGLHAAPFKAQRVNVQSEGWVRLLQMVADTTGTNFSGYKEETLQRRVERRMSSLAIAQLHSYVTYCQRHPQELHTLQQHFLVSFSTFFRDRSSFQVVWQAIDNLVKHKPAEAPIRIWVPACAGGEEAYTLAIILAEVLGGAGALHRVSILGTDLSPRAIEAARAGHYRPASMREVDDVLVQRYFTHRGRDFEVCEALRACCQFQQGNVFDGMPPNTFDLVSCRNLLIYLKPEPQAHLLHLLYQALLPDGLLFVAPVESVGVDGSSLFLPLDRDHRLYRRRAPGKTITPWNRTMQ